MWWEGPGRKFRAVFENVCTGIFIILALFGIKLISVFPGVFQLTPLGQFGIWDFGLPLEAGALPQTP